MHHRARRAEGGSWAAGSAELDEERRIFWASSHRLPFKGLVSLGLGRSPLVAAAGSGKREPRAYHLTTGHAARGASSAAPVGDATHVYQVQLHSN